MTLILRVSRDDTGHVTGIVERVRTGEKTRFEGLEDLATVIARMVAAEAEAGWAGTGTGR